jgi:histidinol-phosphate aminotransferase
MAAGLGSIIDEEYTLNNCKKIIENREYTVNELNKLGFECLDSSANFILAKHPEVNGEKIYLKLKEKGILIRHFDKKEIINYNRITVGSLDQMNKFLEVLKVVLEDK